MSEMMERVFEGGLLKVLSTAMLSSAALMLLGCAGSIPVDPPDGGQVGLGTNAGDATGVSDGGFGDGGIVDSGSSSSDTSPIDGDPGTSPSGKACPPQAFGPETEGCTMTLRTPTNCATIGLSEEFAWEADACHTPYYIQVTGNPPDENNYNEIYVDAYINALAWAEPFSMEFIDGLDSADGWYHWRICNAYLSGCSATRAFRME